MEDNSKYCFILINVFLFHVRSHFAIVNFFRYASFIAVFPWMCINILRW